MSSFNPWIRLFLEIAVLCAVIGIGGSSLSPKAKRYILVPLALLGALILGTALVGCAGEDTIHCSYTCVADGIAETASVCKDHPLREEICEEPNLMRRPEVDEKVRVYSSDDSRKTTVVSVSKNSFRVGGPPNERELGSAVIATEDGALLGIVQEYDDESSECSFVTKKDEE